MRRHVQILGWLYLIMGALGVLGALIAMGVITGAGILSGDAAVFGTMALIGGFIGVYLLIVSVPSLIVGAGLLLSWGGWVIILAVILGVLNLVNFPFGTALAAYTFWVAYRLSADPTDIADTPSPPATP